MEGKYGFCGEQRNVLLLVFSVPVIVPSIQCQLRTYIALQNANGCETRNSITIRLLGFTRWRRLAFDMLNGITFTTNIPFVD